MIALKGRDVKAQGAALGKDDAKLEALKTRDRLFVLVSRSFRALLGVYSFTQGCALGCHTSPLPGHFPLRLAVLLAVTISGIATAEDGCCAHCGCHAPCRKICRLVREEKKVEVLCWGYKCEDFCVPCHSTPGCQHCETVCDDCTKSDPAAPHAEPKRFIWFDWFPGGARIYTRTKLMRKTEEVTVPSYKWVAEDLCDECTAKAEQLSATRVAERPAGPPSPIGEGLRDSSQSAETR